MYATRRSVQLPVSSGAPTAVQPVKSTSLPSPDRTQGFQGFPTSYGRAVAVSGSQGAYSAAYTEAGTSPTEYSPGSPSSFGPIGTDPGVYAKNAHQDWKGPLQASPDMYLVDQAFLNAMSSPDLLNDVPCQRDSAKTKSPGKQHAQRRPSNRDEFDGPHQLLDRPSPETIAAQEQDLPHLPTNLFVQEQDDVLAEVNDQLSKCAFDFIAKYQFPIPLESDKRPVRIPADREWTEWVYLLKRLATKRRIPARVLYNGQIKQFVTVLENSLEMRHAAKHQSRPLKDDRNVLQLISAGIQVTKILKDAHAMQCLDRLYVSTEMKIRGRINQNSFAS
ncbi:MAG: hypothetical protein M1813_001850 [Trichoglossum hirsutum]|nr:MAG: hypothetical protein M1813_001850 [Trichoglossum hirsutum]